MRPGIVAFTRDAAATGAGFVTARPGPRPGRGALVQRPGSLRTAPAGWRRRRRRAGTASARMNVAGAAARAVRRSGARAGPGLGRRLSSSPTATATNSRRPRRPRPRRAAAAIWPLPRARPFSIASSTSALRGRSWSRFGPTFADALAAAERVAVAAALPEQLAALLLQRGELGTFASGIESRSCRPR